jgi:hypothetical protein
LGAGGTLEALVQKKLTRSLFAITATCALSLPAHATPSHRATTFWGEMLRWVESFWEGRSEWGEKLGPLSDPYGATSAASSPDKLGPLGDPDGKPVTPPAPGPANG